MTTSIAPKVKLVGPELKKKVDDLIKAGQGFSACCRETGYTNRTKAGTEIPAASMFSRALLDAVGYEFPSSSGGGGGGRGRTYKVNVMGGGNAIISKGYLSEAGFGAGDELKISIDDNGAITLELDTASGGGASGAPEMRIEPTTREDSFADSDWENSQQINF